MTRIFTLEEIAKMPRGTLDGYVIRYLPNGVRRYKTCNWAFEHRLVMEAILGRLLGRKEDVHHENRNKQDNAPTNLELKSKAEHQRGHVKRTGEWRNCVTCKAQFWCRAAHRRYRRRTCSLSCYWKTPAALRRRKRYEASTKPNVELNLKISAMREREVPFREIADKLSISIKSCHNRFHWVRQHPWAKRRKVKHGGTRTAD